MKKSSQSSTMSCSCLLLLFHFLLLLKFSSLSLGASDSVYDSFVNCLTTKSIPQSEISKIVYSPNNASFNPILQAYVRNRRFFNSSTTSKPVIIVTPTEESHVSSAVLCTKETNLQLKIRSGGHDYEGISYISDVPFIMLDMFNLRSISINVNDNTAWVQAGATLGELYYNIWTKSNVLGFPAGVCPTVGVGGHLSGGGYGNMLRKFGLSVDNVLDARLVDVNGRIWDRKAMGEDLFWAIKGGGGASFGVILAFQIQLVQVPQTVTYFRVERFLDQNATDAVLQWQNVVNKIDNDLFIRLLVQPITVKNKEKKVKGKKKAQQKSIRVTFIALFLGDSSRLISLVSNELPALGLTKQDCFEMSWIDSVLQWANFDNTTKPIALLNRTGDPLNFLKRKSDYVQEPIPRDGLESIFQKMISLGKAGIVFNPYGGRMAEIAEGETPFPHRAGILFKIQYSVNWNEEGAAAEKEYLTQIGDLYSFMTPFVSKNPRQAYLNYRDLDIGTNDQGPHSLEEGRVYGTMYFKNNFDRLVKVKSAVDPTNFFRNEQSIPTQGTTKPRKMF
ncbi:berberine bridge enzyme-like 21 [Nicotiana tabacum]|uniref:Berberine bridge enzyme-like 21 n=2 Tax=Nicotiana TaxID=4085 RepID=A0A1S3XLB2_TOBAC|nr:PREDICTED: reticuline oxidase-like protein [Nicotiana sylvestris]XP_016440708.1 PREDICTED: reticuline oxidase-like protein [Nicotiana tabacum]